MEETGIGARPIAQGSSALNRSFLKSSRRILEGLQAWHISVGSRLLVKALQKVRRKVRLMTELQADFVATHRCLLVEDEDDIREALTCWVELRGWRVTAVASVTDARCALAQDAYDVVVSDFRLPGGTGSHVFAAARRVPTRAPVCILVSGIDAHELVQRPEERADYSLPKPFSLEALGKLLDSALSSVGH
jgi:CheY-like chemotaxis protein